MEDGQNGLTGDQEKNNVMRIVGNQWVHRTGNRETWNIRHAFYVGESSGCAVV